MTPPASSWIRIAPEITAALDAGGGVVALESAVLSHGLPQAQGRALARRLDGTVRIAGAVPALVAVREGRVEVGVDPSDVGFLFDAGVVKISSRDLGAAVALRQSGGTTVAGTLVAAHAAGIRVMATGGIGGVHIGAEASRDISADLLALSRFPLVVVCAGPKAICDPHWTWEALDTLGVSVVGFRTDTLPAFLARSTGIAVSCRVETARDVAAIAKSKAEMRDPSALLVVQPPPPEVAMDGQGLSRAVTTALERARAAAVGGAALTPYLLREIAEVTEGEALAANLAVLEANASLAAAVAVEISHPGRDARHGKGKQG
ncbi:MAG: pseudouridine-5'-phosphate glycosidase [Armatimonadetes bacterium]|nr:pseudouridine-5'-phosphate glycosidase [Armatimonadota bacterium]